MYVYIYYIVVRLIAMVINNQRYNLMYLHIVVIIIAIAIAFAVDVLINNISIFNSFYIIYTPYTHSIGLASIPYKLY